ncbi:NmrA family NAD(P)-binding protein [Caulobacter sp. S45]|uniref:NmrA family NAD(P)-binding protein n=1 Tax=Caulobacter sp. S45 TaxID=1641861 RepID=UPI00131D0541|nr:NmrA family NAD(P)-binding protein [Caulobacter sp. S45]
MFVVMGVTGQVGGVVAETLLAAGEPVRAVVRSGDKGRVWADRGCEIAIVPAITDGRALAEAFKGADGVFLMTPPNYDPTPGFPDTHEAAAAIKAAIAQSRPGRVVFLSTVGAHVEEFNLLNNSAITEAMLRSTGAPVAILRAAWFMENAAWDVAAAREGRFETYLSPIDHRIDMVSVRDIGRTAAELVQGSWAGQRVVELRGPARYSAQDEAAAFAAALGHPVLVEAAPHDHWEANFRAQGMTYPEPRIRMLDGFNEGWIDFEGGDAEQRTGSITFAEVLEGLVERSPS